MRKFLLLCIFVSIANFISAQEICDNGIDDDLDGFVDCYDRDCPNSPACEDFFITEDPSCEATPTQFPTFSIKLAWASENRTATDNSLASIGDVDGDGIPEVISTNAEDRTVFKLSGIDGSIESQITLANEPYLEVMHADIDRDGCAEIFVPTQRSFGITALDCNLSTVLWTTTTVGRPGNIGVADFDEDGLAEIYAKDEIFDAYTGTRMRASDFNNTVGSPNYIERNISNNGVAVDILDDSECANCAGLEYVVGGRIYSVSINRGSMTATMNLERSIDHLPVYYAPWQQNRSGTSVADYNLDGYLDVICNGSTSTDPRNMAFFWDVHNDIVKIYADPTYNWPKGSGRFNIADVDGDGQLNATFVTGQYLYALDENWQRLWRSVITESSSGTTGTTVFDFNGDGTFETVYRDESFLYIVNGTNGTFFQSIPCKSLTYTEYPIVADLDGDGSTEICVTCLTNNGGNINDIGNAQIRVFESNGEQWVTARKIWNQHGYFNVNINDDGTVPIEMQKHHLIFSSGVCSTGGDIRPLNTFLNQAPFITSDGCANYSAPDLNFAGNVSYTPPQCPETNFTVSFDVSNTGDREVSASVPITFYDGDPTQPGAIRLNTVNQLLFIGVGQTVTVSNLTVIGPGGDFNLYISVNDDGSQNPPITLPAGGIVECDFGNNIGSIPTVASPFSISVQKISDNNKCDPLAPDNGSASASTSGYSNIYFEDFEDLAIGSTSDLGSSGWTRTVPPQADWAEVRNDTGDKEFGTRDSDGEVVWRSATLDITNYTSVRGSLALTSIATGGDVFESGDYIRAYYSIDGGAEVALTNGDFTGAVGPTIAGTGIDSEIATFSGLSGSNLEIIVRMANSANEERYYIDNIDIEGFGTVTAGYTFNWYFGASVSEPPDFVGSTHTGMAEGVWTVFSNHTASGCTSDTVQVTIDLTSQNPTVEVTLINAYSNCHNPDGQLLAVVNGGAPESDFDFEWYEGLDIFTSPVLGINALVTNLNPTTYTVVVTEKASMCQTIRSGTVPADASFPVVNPQVDQEVTNCINDDGAISATVSGAGIIWLEDFQDLTNGTTIDNGTTAWSRAPAPSGSGRADVRNVNGSQVFEVRNSGGNEIVFTTETIDISNLSTVDISIDLSASSHMEISSDYLRVYYQINGGSEIPLDSGLQAGSFGNIEAIANGLSGTTLTIVARIRNNRDNERYQIDNITVSGVGEFTTGYDFEWYIGDVVKPSPDFTGTSVTNLPDGNYTVTATSQATGCTSTPVTITVGSLASDPVITTSIDSQQTSCDPANPNGSASASVGGVTAGLTFNWFAGQNTNPLNELTGSPNHIVTGLSAGIYTVMATVDSTGCFSTAEVTITDNIIYPSLTAIADADQTICTPGANDGQVSANVGGVTAGYTFYWFDGNIGVPDINNPDFVGEIYAGLAAGDYTVIAVDNLLTCASIPQVVTVADNTVFPVITETLTDQTSCDVANPNGAIDALADGTIVGYTFNIYAGQNTNPINEVPGSPSASVTGLAAGIYTILVTNDATGCSDTKEVTIVDNIVDPIVTAAVDADQTICTPGAYDGQVSASVGGVTAGYTFYWFDGNIGVPDINNPDFVGEIYAGLAAGEYTVVAVDNALTCASIPQVVTVAENTVFPVITETLTDQTSCDVTNPNGAIDVLADGTIVGYTFNIYAGQNTNPINEVPGSPSASVTGLAAGIYTILVTNDATGCSDTKEVTIVDNIVNPIVTAAVDADQTICTPGANDGQVSASVGGVTAGYTFYWFDGNIGVPDINNPDFVGEIYAGLAAGDYTVVAVDNALTCASIPQVVTVADNTVFPVITETLTDQTSCDVANPNGAIDALADGTIVGYTFNIYAGQNTNPINEVPGSPSASVTGLAAGIYTILVTNDATGCSDTKEVTIVDNIVDPIVTAAVDADQTICTPGAYDGQVSASVGGVTTGYTFYWFDGNIGVPDINNPDFVGEIYAGLAAGDYTVIAVDNILTCASIPQVVTVAENTVFPVITETLTDQTSCDVTNPNGAIDVLADGTIVGYTFNIYAGQNTSPANEVPGSPNSSVAGLASGLYTILATNDATGCAGTLEVNIINNIVDPVVTAVVDANQTICTPGAWDSQVSASIGGITAGYTFYWFDGNVGTPDINSPDFTGITYSGLPAGDYTVVAVDNALTCESNPQVVTVNDITVSPVITATLTDQTSCDVFNPNGAIDAMADGTTLGYTFNIYAGQNTNPGNEVPGSPNSFVTGLPARIYTIQATSDATGCVSTMEVTIMENIVDPVVTAVVDADQTICTPGAYDGQVSANVGGITAGYNFYWFNGNIPVPNINNADFTGITYTGLPAGDYTVVAEDNTTTCLSNPQTVTVIDNTVFPVITETLTDQTSCDPANPNGAIDALADGATAGYTFNIYAGQNTNPVNEVPGSPNASVSGLAAGTYTLLVTNDATGCSEIKEITINEILTIPVPTPAITDQTTCVPINGILTADVGGIVAGYTFHWFDGHLGGSPDITNSDYTGAVVGGIASGDYTLVAVDNVTACESLPVQVTVNDVTVDPVVATMVIDQTACDPALANGQLSATGDGSTAGYTFQWFTGQNTNPVNEILPSPGATLTDLAAGIYTVRVTNDATGCVNTAEATVNDNIILPVITSLTPTDQSDCNAPDGTITVNMSIPDPAVDYTYELYAGSVVSGAPLDAIGPGTNVFNGLNAGTYTVSAFNSTLGCSVINPETTTINRNAAAITTITENVGLRTIPSDCATNAGTLGVDASSPGNATGFSFTWYLNDITGLSLIGPGTDTNGPPVTQNQLTGLVSNPYTVIVTDLDDGCEDTLNINLPFLDQHGVTLTVAVTDQTDCVVPNGSADLGIIIPPATILAVPGVDFSFYKVDVYKDGVFDRTIDPAIDPVTIIPNLVAGDYTVVVTENNAAFPFSCASEPLDFTIAQTATDPVVTADLIVNNTNCAGATENGSIQLAVDGIPTPAAGYSYDWFEGMNSGAPALPGAQVVAPGHTAIELGQGFYHVEVTDLANNCIGTGTFNVINDLPVVSIASADITITPNDNCNPENGEATVTDVLEDGVSQGTAGYEFEWFDASLVNLSGPAPVNTLSSLAPDLYHVQARNTLSNCFSSARQFEIPNISSDPIITAISITPNVNCGSPAVPTGSVTIDVNGAAPLPGDYLVEWFEDAALASPIGSSFGSVVGAGNETAQNLPAGRVYVRVTDLITPNESCTAVESFNIVNDLPVVTINLADITLTPNDNCNPSNGEAEVTDVLEDGVSQGTAGYEFEWFDVSLINLSGPAAATTFSNLNPDFYYVQARNTVSNCLSSPVQFEILDIKTDPVITLNSISPNIHCGAPAIPTGSVTIDVDGATPLPGDYLVEWFEDGALTIPLGTNFGSVVGAGNETAQELLAGRIYVRVTDLISPNQSCSATAVFNILNDQPVVSIALTDITVTPNDNCSPGNGEATVIDVHEDGISQGTAGYEFTWLDDALGNISGPAPANTLSNLDPGIYNVQARNTVSNCQSSAVQFVIQDISTNPVITAASINPNINCGPPSLPTGSVTINVNGAAPLPGDYLVEWFEDATMSITLGTNFGTVAGAADETAMELPAGNVYVMVTDLNSPNQSCSATGVFHIIDDQPVLSIASADLALTDQDDCSPFNGSAQVNDIRVDGVAAGSTLGYSFEWFESDGSTLLAGAGNAATVGTPLDGGPQGGNGINYFVRATHTTSNCATSLRQFKINNIATSPLVVATTINPNTQCTGAVLPDGSITIDIDGGTSPANYLIEWFEGNTIGVPLGTAVPTASAGGINGEVVTGLTAGQYTVQVTDLVNPDVGCETVAVFTILNDQPVLSIASADLALTDQDDCSPFNGSAQVNDIRVDGIAAGSTLGYSFEWFESDGSTLLAGAGNAAAVGTPLDGGPQGGNGINYFVRATHTTSNCATSLRQFKINNIATSPLVVATTINPNTQCTGAVLPDGSITIDIDGGTSPANYLIEWFEGNTIGVPLGTAVPTASAGGINGEVVTGLTAGQYTVQVTDLVNPDVGCETVAVFTILNDQPVLSIASADLALTDQDDCSPFNGSAQVNDIRVDGIAAGSTLGYSFEWFESDGSTLLAGAGNAAAVGTPLDGGPQGGNGINYFVRATHTTSNCATSLRQFKINNIATSPLVVATTINPNTQCTGAVLPDGSITIDIDGGTSPANYLIEWFEGNTIGVPLGTAVPTASAGGINGEVVTGLTAGQYTVQVTDLVNPDVGCETVAVFTILNDQPVLSIASADLALTDQDDCSPFNGSAQVNDIRVDGIAAGSTLGYSFEWFESDGSTLLAGAGNAAAVGTPLDGGPQGGNGINYFVRATHTTSNCATSLRQFKINNIATSPLVVATTINPNTQCTGAVLPDGSITIDIDGGTSPANYLIEWFEGNTIGVPLGTAVPTASAGGINGEVVTGLTAGQYTVQVTDLVNPDVGCETVAVFTILNDQPVLSIASADILLLPNSRCVGPDGSATINFVSEDGIQVPVANYEFEWFDENLNTLSGPSPVNSLGNLFGGTYYVTVRNITSQCVLSSPIEFEIEDLTVPPQITLFDFVNPTRCEGSNAQGNLRVMADGSTSMVDYTFTWYAGGIPVSGPPLEPNNYELINIASGDYTVVVTNNSSGCYDEETYSLVTEIVDLQAAVSSSPVTSCISDNGSVFATITNAGSNYEYYWYAGETVTATPDYTTQQVTGLPEGEYTVVIVDQNDAFCETEPLTVYVEEQKIYPDVNILQNAPSTHCDPALANGQLSASVNGQIIGYTFEWRAGIDSTSTNVIYTGPTIDNLYYGNYTVIATNNISGCSNSEVYAVPDESLPAPAPTAVVLSNQTSCIVPNGAVEATVSGITREFTFNWYNGSTVDNTSDFVGSKYTGLDIGPYTVTATQIASGCVSEPVTVEVLDEIVYPEFDLRIGNASCESSTGYILVEFLPGYPINRVEWDVYGEIITAPGIYDQPAGEYEVTVYGPGECTASKTAYIGTDILVYNGVSPNGDNSNDFWIIDCIGEYLNNNVKIFNRSGQLVYEADYYNNSDNRFEGFGNRGIYLSGNNLPDGTYFYIINKGDGSEPFSGYLELIR